VHELRRPLFANERTARAGVYGHVRPGDELEDLERVRGRLLQRLVARHGGDAEELDLR
jgi:hypothetical protein